MTENVQKKEPGHNNVRAFLFKANRQHAVSKADSSTQLRRGEITNASTWMQPVYDQEGLERLVDESTILLQCIDAYASNIVGFGIDVRYREDLENIGDEQEAELLAAREKLRSLCVDMDITKLFEYIVTARETFGTAYLEVMRDMDGSVRQIEFVEDTATVQKSQRDDTPTTITVLRQGVPVTYDKKFCRYRQQVVGKTVYYKEFGDPRMMDNRTGQFVEPGELLPSVYQANELLEFALGSKPYGRVRWRGNILGIDGAHRAEALNNNYFVNGRHTPLLIMIRGGMLDRESEEQIQDYMNNLGGEDSQHKFLVLCTESTSENAYREQNQQQPDIQIVPLANILQRDELFGEYIDSKRKQVQSSFRLPDLYVGYTTDFNRATAQTAQEVTEQQVFQKERAALAWIINNKLLSGFGYQYVEAYFMEPDITNPDDLHKIMTVCNNAGGLTPNKAKEVLYSRLGEQADPYLEPWGDVPLAISQTQAQAEAAEAQRQQMQGLGDFGGYDAGFGDIDFEALGLDMAGQVQKAERNGEKPELIHVLKGIQETFLEMATGEDDQ